MEKEKIIKMEITKEEKEEIIEKRKKKIKRAIFKELRAIKKETKEGFFNTAKTKLDVISDNLTKLIKLKNEN